MLFNKTSTKFGQWADSRANTVYGLGFSSDLLLNKFSEQFEDIRLDEKTFQEIYFNQMSKINYYFSTVLTNIFLQPICFTLYLSKGLCDIAQIKCYITIVFCFVTQKLLVVQETND